MLDKVNLNKVNFFKKIIKNMLQLFFMFYFLLNI